METLHRLLSNQAKSFVLIFLLAGVLLSCGGSQATGHDPPVNRSHVAVVKVKRQDLTSTLTIASEFLP